MGNRRGRGVFHLLSLLVFLVFASAPLPVHAQDTETEPVDGTEAEAPAPAPTPPAPKDPLADIGDIIHLKSGGSIKGQVMAPQRGAYPVEIITGVTINVPVSQVTEIDYDDYEAYEARQLIERARNAKASGPIASSKLSPELSRKMNTPISNSPDPLPVPFDNLVGVLEHLAKVCDVTIQIGDGVKNLPPDRLAWQGTIAPGTTLFGLFQETILPTYGDRIGVDFEFDHILIRLPRPQGE